MSFYLSNEQSVVHTTPDYIYHIRRSNSRLQSLKNLNSHLARQNPKFFIGL
jgi:hypothetical protein